MEEIATIVGQEKIDIALRIVGHGDEVGVSCVARGNVIGFGFIDPRIRLIEIVSYRVSRRGAFRIEAFLSVNEAFDFISFDAASVVFRIVFIRKV